MNNKIKNGILNGILKHSKGNQHRNFHQGVENNQTFSNVAVFNLTKLEPPKIIKITKSHDGTITFRKQDSNKFKGLTVSTVLTDDELEELKSVYFEDDK